METSRNCPQCRQPLSADAPGGLCPQCLLRAVAGPPPSGSSDELACDIIDIGDPAEVGKKLPQFEILEILGRGGMGVVYKARQLQLDRIVALKILPPVDALSVDFVARFTREARALAKLNHPNIVSVFDFGETGGLYFIVMEYVEGANLRQLLETRKLTPEEALTIVPKICDALEYAHEEGLVHRDIKPENLLIDKKGRVKIADFGLAKLLQREALDMTLTLSGMTVGTVRYMAPEQMEKPETVDHRADLYSLGVVFYEMLTGETPVGRFQLPSQKAQVDARLDEIVLHALEKEPDRRYQRANEMKTEVESVSSTPRPAVSLEQPGAKPWIAWIWWAVLCLVPLPFLIISEENRAALMAGHGPSFFQPGPRSILPGWFETGLLSLGAYAVIRLLELRRLKAGASSRPPFSQPWLGIVLALLGVCIFAVGPFPYVEWFQQTFEVMPVMVTNRAGATVELPAFTETFIKHGGEFWQGKAIAAIGLLVAVFVVAAPHRLRWNAARSALLLAAGLAIRQLAANVPMPGERSQIDLGYVATKARTNAVYQQFLRDFRDRESGDAVAKNVSPDILCLRTIEGILALNPHSTQEERARLGEQMKHWAFRSILSYPSPAHGGAVCSYAGLALLFIGVMAMRQTMAASPAAFAGFRHLIMTWRGMALLIPCLLSVQSSWVESVAWIAPGRENPVIINLPERRLSQLGEEFWQGRVIAAACGAAILGLIFIALRRWNPGVRAAALSFAGVLGVVCSISFFRMQLGFTEVSWRDFHAVARHGAAAAESVELRRALEQHPAIVGQLASTERDVQAYVAKLKPESAEARKMAQGPEVTIYQNIYSGFPYGGPDSPFLYGVGLVLLGLRDAFLAWRSRRKEQTPARQPTNLQEVSNKSRAAFL